ncbi:MAG: tRNA pseudouridine(38-40) synthase TruA [Candidatus Binatus sp.]|uniref:tRNA pseudouridine(38-40) synthase TruA n=1 Tax=Candidatus Binatus sp. TaxID=2811406 RepID=UPI00271EA7EB|nr:tRNA pseudouridine(38-40) synthase TruA [Candidatus Binatus sp.]MDO8433647.1 tRNA pseudouridine(38-40) synthase TruA [Candidatus Binatus sp.]
MLLKLTIEYDGANYSGWQLQAKHDSIQGRIEGVLERIFAASVRVHGSGRTDAGVHARGQIASIKLPRDFDPPTLMRALNAMLPPDIVVLDVAEVPDDFNPRRHATSRVYEYRVLNRRIQSAFDYRYSWLVRESLDLSAMNDAARVFLGEHDFAAFQTLGSDAKTTVRSVFVSEWNRDGVFLVYRVEANSFLRHMVRTMVAAMVEAGKNKLSAPDIAAILLAGNRRDAPAPAPPGGLCLVEVRY